MGYDRRRTPATCWVAFAVVPLMLVAVPLEGGAQLSRTATRRATADVPVYRHSPIFGLGPQTIWKGGWGIEVGGEWIRTEGNVDREQALHAKLLYGVTEDFNVDVALPLVQRKAETTLIPGAGQVVRDATGVGDAVLRVKYRFWQDLFPGGNHQATLFGGLKLPVGRTDTEPRLSSGSVDFLVGAAISRETHRYYGWVSALGRLNTKALDRRKGHEVRYDLALGLRPYVPQWTSPDLMFVFELVGVTAARSVTAEGEIPDSGGTALAFSPGFWLTYRNWAVKSGVKLPFVQNLNGTQPELDFEAVASLEYHFGG